MSCGVINTSCKVECRQSQQHLTRSIDFVALTHVLSMAEGSTPLNNTILANSIPLHLI